MRKIKNYLSKPMSRGDYLLMILAILVASIGYTAWLIKSWGGWNIFGKSTDDEEEDKEEEIDEDDVDSFAE